MTTQLTQILEVAKDILATAGRKGMSVAEISEAAAKQAKNMSLSVDEFSRRLQPALAANLKLKAKTPTFAPVNWDRGPRKGKPRQGWFRLRRQPPPKPEIEPPQTGKLFTGKAGEYAVMSELLFWEFNVSVMVVDDGIDLVASKSNAYFNIQVKTATEQDGGKFQFNIDHTSFRKHDSATMFYVFVLRRGLKNEFIIIPSITLRTLIGEYTSKSPKLSVVISVDQKGVKYSLNGKTDVTPYFGNFEGVIAPKFIAAQASTAPKRQAKSRKAVLSTI